jgi:hypothetical protein
MRQNQPTKNSLSTTQAVLRILSFSKDETAVFDCDITVLHDIAFDQFGRQRSLDILLYISADRTGTIDGIEGISADFLYDIR